MAFTSLENQFISASFGQLLQISGSGNVNVADGFGNDLSGSVLMISASSAQQTDSAVSASYASTASIADSATSSSYAATASIADNATSAATATSASHAVNSDIAISSSYASNSQIAVSASQADSAISSSYALTASFALNVPETASYAISASHALNADSSISSSFAATASILIGSVESASYAATAESASHALNADHAIQADDLVITVRNDHGFTISKGTAVHATGVVGENVTVLTASADNPSLMPAIGVTNANINAGAVGEVIIAGRLIGFSTTGLVAGDSVYVNNGGLLTATKPTGSSLIQNIGTAAKIDGTDGEVIIQGAGRTNDLPNITAGSAWVGGANGVAVAVATSSFAVASAISASHADNASTADSATSASYATTASHADNASTSDLATTASFASSLAEGIDVNLRSGSFDVITAGTASIGFLESITGSAKIIGDAFIILNNNTPTERYAGIKVQDSGSTQDTASLQWDGDAHDWFYEFSSSATHEYGVVLMGPEYDTLGSPIYPTANEIQMGNGDHHITGSKLFSDTTKVYTSIPISSSAAITSSAISTGDIDASAITGSELLISGTGSFGKIEASGSVNLAAGGYGILSDNNSAIIAQQGGAALSSSISGGGSGNAIIAGDRDIILGSSNTAIVASSAVTISGSIQDGAIVASEQSTLSHNNSAIIGGISITSSADNTVYVPNLEVTGNLIATINSASYALSASHAAEADTAVTASYVATASHALNADNAVSASYALVASSATSASHADNASTADSATSASFAQYVADGIALNDPAISGSMTGDVKPLSIASSTASMDCSTGNFFTLTLASSATTHLDASNIAPGQTINVKITQPATTGSLSFSSDFAFPTGSTYAGSEVANAIDVISMVSFDSTKLYANQIENLV